MSNEIGLPADYAPFTRAASTQSSQSKSKQASASSNGTLSMDDFLMLMVKQFQNQDIENPASTSDMLNQLVQMSTVQAMSTMSDAVSLTYASSLVGKEVTVGVYENGGITEIVGTVTGTGTYNGEQVIFVNDKSYSISSIMAVGKLPPKEEDKVDPDKDDSASNNTQTGSGDVPQA